jgi:hypothetical protein
LEAQLENVYLSKLDHEEIDVDARELKDVQNSRNPLYREAAILLDNYRRIVNGDLHEEEIRALLRMKPFSPPDTREGNAALFELYWIFKILDQFDDPSFKQITTDRSQLVAEWNDDGHRYLLFNDWDGRTHDELAGYLDYIDISWGPEELDEASKNEYPDHFMRRRQTILEIDHQISSEVFNFKSGRKTPDIVLLKLSKSIQSPELRGLFIGEVKHSTNNDYIKSGLSQLLEYGAHAKFGDQLRPAEGPSRRYICKNPDFLGTPVLELGYFVGDASMVKGRPPDGIQICGFGELPRRPFSESPGRKDE